MRLSWSRKISLPLDVMADIAETPPRLPVTVCLGVLPQGAQVFAKSAVKEMFASSWKYRIARYFTTARRSRSVGSARMGMAGCNRRAASLRDQMIGTQCGNEKGRPNGAFSSCRRSRGRPIAPSAPTLTLIVVCAFQISP